MAICMKIKPFVAMKNDVIYRKGEVSREIFIVIDGEVLITFDDDVATAASRAGSDRMRSVTLRESAPCRLSICQSVVTTQQQPLSVA